MPNNYIFMLQLLTLTTLCEFRCKFWTVSELDNLKNMLDTTIYSVINVVMHSSSAKNGSNLNNFSLAPEAHGLSGAHNLKFIYTFHVIHLILSLVYRTNVELKWKLSPCENRSRMRLKLVPNPHFDPHTQASRLRDNTGMY